MLYYCLQYRTRREELEGLGGDVELEAEQAQRLMRYVVQVTIAGLAGTAGSPCAYWMLRQWPGCLSQLHDSRSSPGKLRQRLPLSPPSLPAGHAGPCPQQHGAVAAGVPQPRQLSIHDPLQSHQGAGGGGAGAHLIYLSKWADLPPNGQICLSEMIHCWPCCSGSEHVAARLLLLLPASSAADGAEARVPCVLLCGAVLRCAVPCLQADTRVLDIASVQQAVDRALQVGGGGSWMCVRRGDSWQVAGWVLLALTAGWPIL